MSIDRYIGIDFDTHGAVAYIDVVDGEVQLPGVFDTPTFELTFGKTTRAVIDIPEMARILLRLAEGDPEEWEDPAVGYIAPPDNVTAVLERAQAMPAKMGGGIANFVRGRCSAAWEGALAAAGIPYSTEAPRTWKVQMGLKVGAEKDDSIAMAKRNFPGSSGLLSRKKDHGRAEAMLIAQYCYAIHR